MTLREQLAESGQNLFRKRSWLPLLILGVVPAVFFDFDYPFRRHDVQELWTFLCIGIAVVGQILRFITIAHVPPRTSGRNRKAQVADALNTDGTYSIVRNPLYLGNFLTWLGLAAVPHSPWPWLAVALVFWIYHERVILAEEAFLESKFGDEFREWASRTPAFIPDLRLWRSPELGFSFRTALGREYVNLFAVFTGFAAFDAIADSAAEHHLHIDRNWAIAWILAFATFVVLRILKKCTQVFCVAGREW